MEAEQAEASAIAIASRARVELLLAVEALWTHDYLPRDRRWHRHGYLPSEVSGAWQQLVRDTGIPAAVKDCVPGPVNEFGVDAWRVRIAAIGGCPRCSATFQDISTGLKEFRDGYCAHGTNVIHEVPPDNEHPALTAIRTIAQLPWAKIINDTVTGPGFAGRDTNGWLQRRDAVTGALQNMGVRVLKEEGRYEVSLNGRLWQKYVEVGRGEESVAKLLRDYVDVGMLKLGQYKDFEPEEYSSLLVDISLGSSRQCWHIDATRQHAMVVLHVSDNSAGTHFYKGSSRVSASQIVDDWDVSGRHGRATARSFEALIAKAKAVRGETSALLLTPQHISDGEATCSPRVPAGTIRVANGDCVHAGPSRVPAEAGSSTVPSDTAPRVMMFTTYRKKQKRATYDADQTYGQLYLLSQLCEQVWDRADAQERCILIEQFDVVLTHFKQLGIENQCIIDNIDVDVGDVSYSLEYIARRYLSNETVDLNFVVNWDCEVLFGSAGKIVRFHSGEQLAKWRVALFSADKTVLCHLREMADTFHVSLIFSGVEGVGVDEAQEVQRDCADLIVSITDQHNDESSRTLKDAVAKGVGWEHNAEKHKLLQTSLFQNCKEIVRDAGCVQDARNGTPVVDGAAGGALGADGPADAGPVILQGADGAAGGARGADAAAEARPARLPHAGHASAARRARGHARGAAVPARPSQARISGLTNCVLFGSVAATDDVLVARGIIDAADKTAGDHSTTGNTMSIAWGFVSDPWEKNCDHLQWRLSCLHNRLVNEGMGGTGGRRGGKKGGKHPRCMDVPWADVDGPCTCGVSPTRAEYERWEVTEGLVMLADDPSVSALASEKTQGVGGSTVHCDGAYAALGFLAEGEKTVTIVDPLKTAKVVRMGHGNLRLWAKARGSPSDKNGPLRTIPSTDGRLLFQEMESAGITCDTFRIASGTFYYLPAMVLHEFIDREAIEPAAPEKVRQKPKKKATKKSVKKPGSSKSGKGKAVTEDDADWVGTDSASETSDEENGEDENAGGGSSRKGTGSTPTTIAGQIVARHAVSVTARFAELCKLDEDSEYRRGECVLIAKPVGLFKVSECLCIDEDSDNSDITVSLPPMGESLAFKTPLIMYRKVSPPVAMKIIHAEKFATPGTHWVRTKDAVSPRLRGSDFNLLRERIGAATTEGQDTVQMSVALFESCETPTIKYGDVVVVNGVRWKTHLVLECAAQKTHLRRCLDILDRGQYQKGCTRQQNTRSIAEGVFVPRVFTFSLADLSDDEVAGVKQYMTSVKCLWTSEQVDALMACELLIFASACDATVMGPSENTEMSIQLRWIAEANKRVMSSATGPIHDAYVFERERLLGEISRLEQVQGTTGGGRGTAAAARRS